jgi:hypothetical protein
VVEAALTCGADIHTWAFTYSGEPLEDSDRTGVVAAGFFAHVDSFNFIFWPLRRHKGEIPYRQGEILS